MRLGAARGVGTGLREKVGHGKELRWGEESWGKREKRQSNS